MEEKNETFIKCSECYKSCKQCTGPDSSSCLACKQGWSMNEETQVCEDINECIVDKDACDNEKKFCENNEGSYQCLDCDPSCSGCTGNGNDKCLKCKKGIFFHFLKNIKI